MSGEDAAAVRALKARDQAVRRHEQAHLAAAGNLAVSGASFTYERGPDGVNYAVGGEVSISTAPGRTPEETLQRAEIIRQAALAPADPSGQDRAVAAQAAQMAREARADMASEESGAPAEGSRRSAVERAYGGASSGLASRVNTYA